MGSLIVPALSAEIPVQRAEAAVSAAQVRYRTQKVQDVEIFYREAGPKDAPTVLLLHGFPTSSHMFRDLIPLLAQRYHVIAPPFWFKRTTETEAPMRAFLKMDVTKFQYLHGARDPERISPDAWTHAQSILDRPGNDEIQLSLLHDYGSNLVKYPEWQAYFRQHRPPTLIAWGKNDPFFTVEGARAYLRDLPEAELHLLDAGHFALEEETPRVAGLMLDFLDRKAFASDKH
jgi:pimeloyl-ACP methyl ester carboxylesterase